MASGGLIWNVLPAPRRDMRPLVRSNEMNAMDTKISFILKRDADPSERESLLQRIKQQKSCRAVHFAGISGASKSSLANRLGYVEVDASGSAEELRDYVRSQPEVEAADIEAARGL